MLVHMKGKDGAEIFRLTKSDNYKDILSIWVNLIEYWLDHFLSALGNKKVKRNIRNENKEIPLTISEDI